jgi:hypothetical protein
VGVAASVGTAPVAESPILPVLRPTLAAWLTAALSATSSWPWTADDLPSALLPAAPVVPGSDPQLARAMQDRLPRRWAYDPVADVIAGATGVTDTKAAFSTICSGIASHTGQKAATAARLRVTVLAIRAWWQARDSPFLASVLPRLWRSDADLRRLLELSFAQSQPPEPILADVPGLAELLTGLRMLIATYGHMHVCAEEAVVALGGPTAHLTLGSVQVELAAQAAALPPQHQRLYKPHALSLPNTSRTSAALAALVSPAPLVAASAPAVRELAAGEEAVRCVCMIASRALLFVYYLSRLSPSRCGIGTSFSARRCHGSRCARTSCW